LAAAKPNSGLAAAKLGFGSCQIKNAGMAAARVVFGCNENTNNKNNMKTWIMNAIVGGPSIYIYIYSIHRMEQREDHMILISLYMVFPVEAPLAADGGKDGGDDGPVEIPLRY
jgi:hypothetical protein